MSICQSFNWQRRQGTKPRIADIRSSFDLVSELQKAIQPGGEYAALELELGEGGLVEAFLSNLAVNYTTALEVNLDTRFQEAAPVLESFSIFYPSCLPKPEDPTFKSYGVDSVRALCKQFQFANNTPLHSGKTLSTRCHHVRYSPLFYEEVMSFHPLSLFSESFKRAGLPPY